MSYGLDNIKKKKNSSNNKLKSVKSDLALLIKYIYFKYYFTLFYILSCDVYLIILILYIYEVSIRSYF
jgi:hypothetical protein